MQLLFGFHVTPPHLNRHCAFLKAKACFVQKDDCSAQSYFLEEKDHDAKAILSCPNF